jgi:hypothetical protein
MTPFNNWHVLAAAIHGGAGIIVTWNLKHFPAKALKPHDMVAQSPDTFLAALVKRNEDDATAALRDLRLQLKAPPYSVPDLLAGLERQKLARTVALLRPMVERM